MHRLINRDKLSRLFRLTPLILVIAGFALILVGTTASLKGFKMAGPVVVVVGGLLFLFSAAWSSRPDKFVENTISEEAVIAAEHYTNRSCLSAGSNNQLGPIHHFEVKTSSESQSWKEMVPPSYEEADDNNGGVGNSQTSTEVVPSGAPPSYEESHENAKTVT